MAVWLPDFAPAGAFAAVAWPGVTSFAPSASSLPIAVSIPHRLPVVLRASPAATRLCLLAADIAAVLLARFLGASLWSLVNASIGIDNEFDLWMSLALFLLVYGSMGLYAASG